jgi:hypothetical protein
MPRILLRCNPIKSAAVLRLACAFLLLVGLSLPFSPPSLSLITPVRAQETQRDQSRSPQKSLNRANIEAAYGQLPISFERNQGQTNQKVKFFGRGEGYGVFFTESEAVVALRNPKRKRTTRGSVTPHRDPEKNERLSVLRLRLRNSNRRPQLTGQQELAGTTNYFLGRQAKNWIPDNSTYSRVRYQNVYDGIDLVYYGNSRQLECDFVVAPQADAGRIKLVFAGRRQLLIDDQGDLSVKTNGGEMVLRSPVAYQVIAGVRREVASRFVIESNSDVSFRLGSYDKRESLTIDPIISYSTYLGGSGFSSANDETANGVAVDATGNAYVIGSTVSTDFPVVNAFKPNGGGLPDAFISKINPSGTALIYSTYLGGNRTDEGLGIAIDASGSAYVTGVSSSTDFPTTPGAVQTTGLDSDVFITKLNAAGNGLVYSTLLSGDRTVLPMGGGTLSSAETGFAIAVDSQGDAYVTGQTQSANFPGTPPTNRGPGFDAFVTKLNPTGSAIIFSNYIGGSNYEQANSIALDSSANAYIVGETVSLDYPTTAGAFQTTRTLSGASIGFIAKFSSIGSLVYSSYLGDTFDRARSVAVDGSGNAFVTGETNSQNFPTTPNALKTKMIRGAVFKSGDRGASWSATGLTGDFVVNAIALDASSTNLYAGTQGGLFRSADGGNSWTLTGFGGTDVLSVAVDPSNASRIFVGTNGQGIFRSTDNGTSWTNVVTSATVFTFSFNPQDSLKVYAGIQGSAVLSLDGGDHWESLGSGGGTIRAIAFLPGDPNTIYLAGSTGVIKTINGGSNWTNVLPMSASFVGLAIDPASPATVFAAHRLFGLFKTIDGGQSWNQSNGSLPTQNILSFAGDGTTNPTTFYAGLQDFGVYKSVNGGVNWLPTNLAYSSVNSVAIDRIAPTNLYAGSLVNNNADGFLTEFNATGSTLIYSTYLGGSGYDTAYGLALDANSDPVVVGYGVSVDLPLVNPVKQKKGPATDAFVTKLKMADHTIAFSSYLGGGGIDRATAVASDPSGSIYLVGHTRSSDFPAVSALQPNLNFLYDSFVAKISNAPPPSIQLSASTYPVAEGNGQVDITVNRTGDTTAASTIKYATSDTGSNDCNITTGNASSRCDYESAQGTITFAAGEMSKTISVLVVDDAYAEGNESFTITLSDPAGATLGSPSVAGVTISDNEVANGANPIDQASFFVRQHYLDFLNREPDAGGIAFWSNQITECQLPGATCSVEIRRINVSAAFFLSIEFQETGYLVYRTYKSAFGNLPGKPVPVVLSDFLRDTQEIGRGVVVGATGWEQVLENNKQAYALEFVQRPEFLEAYPITLTADQFVTQLNTNAGGVLSPTEKANLIAVLGATPFDVTKRASVLRSVAEDSDLKSAELNKAFVLMQYFGYLRRNPNDPPEAALNFDGYNFWVNKLNQFNGNFVNAEMVKAFLVSGEYRQRFGP